MINHNSYKVQRYMSRLHKYTMTRIRYRRMSQPDNTESAHNETLPVWRKLCFALGGVPFQMTNNVLGFFFNIFMLEIAQSLHVPYTSLTMCISSKQTDRDSATAYRMVMEAIGVLLAVLIQGKLVEENRLAGKCSGSYVQSHSLDKQKWSYHIGSLIVIALYVVCILFVFFGVKEDTFLKKDKVYSNYFKGLKSILTYGPFVKASLTFLFYSLGISMVQGNIALYSTHSLKLVHFSNYILLALVTSVCSMPLWQYLLTKFGKKKIYATGMIIFLPVSLAQTILPEGIDSLYYIVAFLVGLSVSVSLLLPWSILPDILDLYLVEHQERKDAIFYSFYVFFNKLAIGLGLSISQILLQIGGYKTGACTQPNSVSFTLRLLMTCPSVFMVCGLIALSSYPIDEAKRKEIQHLTINTDLVVNSEDPAGSNIEETKLDDDL